MPSIFLGIQSGFYFTYSVTVYVSQQSISSSLFKKYIHRPAWTHRPGNIYLFKSSSSLSYYSANCATLQPGIDYSGSSLTEAEVYFNKFDPSHVPLLCVFYFNHGKPTLIYRNSEHGRLIDGNVNTNITNLSSFTKSDHKQQLLEWLIEENYKSLNSVTYQLDKTNTDHRETTYNSDKITLSTKQQVATDRTHDLYKHTHKPKDPRTKKSFFLYNNNMLMSSKDRPVSYIQGEPYEYVNVYYKINDSIPLMFELINKNQRSHVNRASTDGSIWLKNDIYDFNEYKLLSYLNYTTDFVEKKKVEEEQKREREKQRERDKGQRRGQETVPRPGSEQRSPSTQVTREQGPQLTPTSQEPTSSGTPSQATVGLVTSSQGQASTSTVQICVLINKQETYEKSVVEELFKLDTSIKPESKVSDKQPTISVLPKGLNDSNYKIYTHTINPNSSKLQPDETQQDIEIELNIYVSNFFLSLYDTTGSYKVKLIHKGGTTKNEICVYFFQHNNTIPKSDTAPLMFHYNGQFYGPSKLDYYFTGWRRIDDIKGTSDTSGIKNQLDRIYNELNKVELNFKNDKTCSYGIPKLGSNKIKDFSTDRIKVKVEQIGSTVSQPPSSSPGASCPTFEPRCPYDSYLKYTHTTINKFQLGNIYYKSNLVKVIQAGELATTNAQPIVIQSTQNLVSVYYWINDKTRTYPLLIGIGRQIDSGGSTVEGVIEEYYKLIGTGASTGTGVSTGNYKWQKLAEPEKPGLPDTANKKFVELLDKINYSVKKVIKILLDKREQYPLCVSAKPGGAGNGFTPYNSKQIEVQAYSEGRCTELSKQGYKCFVHNISKLNENGSGQFDYNSIGGLKFYITGKTGDGSDDVEIPLHKDNGGGMDEKIDQLTYNTCMGDVYVYFYCKQGSGSPDHVPLMLLYNSKFYEPTIRDEYFEKWKQVKSLDVTTKPCGGDNSKHTPLTAKLDSIYNELNKIDLTYDLCGKANSKYGLPKSPETSTNFNKNRVDVTKLDAISNRPYFKIAHRTINEFRIGDIYYKNQEIVANGVKINGASGQGTTIETGSSRHNHTVFLQNNNKPNTVVAYYSISDTQYKLPQIILLMTTNDPIDVSDTPITASDNTQYGYYVLSTTNNGMSYKYEWRRPNDESTPQRFLQLDEETELSLLNSVVLLVDRHQGYQEQEVSAAVKTVSTLISPGNSSGLNRFKDRKIGVQEGCKTHGTGGNYVSKYSYRVFEHDISGLVQWPTTGQFSPITLIGVLRFLIPSSNNDQDYKEINLYSTIPTSGQACRLYHTSNNNKIYIYFYGSDPRPLLICYNGVGYSPNNELTYFDKWIKVLSNSGSITLNQCCCSDGGSPLTNSDNTLLQQLDKVVKFLNRLDLKQGTAPKPSQYPYTYKVQTFKGNKIKIKVECSTVGDTSSGTSAEPAPNTCSIQNTKSCYKKFVHTPHGMNGTSSGLGNNGTGFRLGEIEHNGSTSGSPKSTLNYANLHTSYRYEPLLKVSVYYYDQDSNYADPLLIELEFNVNVGEFKTEYYKLITSDGTGNSLQWQIDKSASVNVSGSQDKLITYLDSIRYLLKKLVRIEIQHNSDKNYELKGRPASGSPGLGYVGIGSGKQIQVVECDDSVCTKLKANNYTCFQHKISYIEDSEQHQIGGLAMTIPGQGDQVVEIPLHNEGGSPLPQLTYNTCMGDVYVYFYCKKDGSTDTVPLMLRYNSKFYEPENRDNYFTKWEESSDLCRILKGPCGDNGKSSILATMLDTVNKALNRIELTHNMVRQSTSKYGLPKSPETSTNFNKNRVDVTKLDAISNRPYCKLVHRTSNGFTIGDIYYKDTDIRAGVTINGSGSGDSISISGDSHTTNFVSTGGSNKPNTVVAYYSTTDTKHILPQLIVLMTTDQPIEEKQDPITAQSHTSYGYYILATCTGGTAYQYEWREPDDTGTPLKLDDTTELSLLNSVVILVEQKPTSQGARTSTYGDDKINNAVQKAIQLKSLTKSPGLKKDINRLKHKQVTLNDETEKVTDLKDTGFIAISHDLSIIVNLNITGADGVTLIAILRFLIPTSEGGGEYKLLSLYDPDDRNTPVTLFHQNKQDSVCVYFYNQDPRPLLLCYNSKGYRATTLYEYELQRWYQGKNITNCCRDKDSGKNLLIALVHVSNYLNRVQIGRGSSGPYTVHKFNGMDIIINLKVTKAHHPFCYHKYTHTHKGMRKSTENGENPKYTEGPSAVQPAQGFRLGRIDYGNSCIKDVSKPSRCIDSLISQTPKFEQSSEVVVYYYIGDPNHQNPLLVVLKNSLGTYNPYYELQRSTDPSITKKVYKKETREIKLEEKPGSDLEKILDRILYYISKSLLIDLSFRARTEVQYPGKIVDKIPTIKHDKYEATVYENESTKPKKTAEKIEIQVSGPTDIGDASGKTTGYQCYQHLLTQIKDINNFGGLRLFLWDNRPDSDDDDTQCKPSPPTTNTKHKCCEIDLHGEDSQPSGTCNKKIDPIAYTTCKGDLYVYFYGSDPRPMLLCYNGQGYAPQSMDEYNKKWCRVSQIKSCECSDSRFKASQDLLNTLYKTSMFLNPVYLWETLKAYKKVAEFIKQEKAKQEQAKKDGKEVPKIGKLPDHVYTVQTFGNYEIRVRVTTSDLQCYRKYTHTPAMAEGSIAISRGYRLGSIFYGSDQGNKRTADQTCLWYPSNQRLQSVSLYYYMYDLQHRYPLIIQLDYGFGGELDDYYRVCTIGGVGAQGSGGGNGGNAGSNGGGGPGGGAPGPAAPPPNPSEIASKITWVKIKCPVTEGHGPGNAHSQDDSGQAQASAASPSSSSSGKCDPECKNPTDYTGKPIETDKLNELKENDSRFVKEAHDVQMKTRKLSLGEHPLFGQQYLDLVAELQALIEARCFDVRRKYKIEYPKGEKNENLILVSDENCYEESIMGYLLGGGALGVAGGGGWKLATFVLTLFIKV